MPLQKCSTQLSTAAAQCLGTGDAEEVLAHKPSSPLQLGWAGSALSSQLHAWKEDSSFFHKKPRAFSSSNPQPLWGGKQGC